MAILAQIIETFINKYVLYILMVNNENNEKNENGFTPMENLLDCILENTATAETFEIAIKQEGLTMEIISLISEYYKDDWMI